MNINAVTEDDLIRGYRIKLYPNEEQKEKIHKFIDLFRYVYNWTLSKEKEIYEETGKFTQNFKMYTIFGEFRNNSNDWLKELPISTAYRAINNAVFAYEKFFKKKAKYPKFKKKKSHKSDNSFSVRSQRIKFYDNEGSVSIEGFGYGNHIKCSRPAMPINTKYYNCTVYFDGDNYWLTVNAKMINPIKFDTTGETIGIDVGVHKFAVLSNGKEYISPDTSKLRKRFKRISKRVQRDIYRRVNLGRDTKTKYEDISKTQNEIKRETAKRKLDRKIANIQNTFSHQVSREIINTMPSKIILENLNISGMVMSSYTSEDLVRSTLKKFRNQIAYKAKEMGIEVEYADMFFPSSQLCSNCGHRQHIGLSRVYKCPVCGLEIDRDLNAAINLKNYRKT